MFCICSFKKFKKKNIPIELNIQTLEAFLWWDLQHKANYIYIYAKDGHCQIIKNTLAYKLCFDIRAVVALFDFFK